MSLPAFLVANAPVHLGVSPLYEMLCAFVRNAATGRCGLRCKRGTVVVEVVPYNYKKTTERLFLN